MASTTSRTGSEIDSDTTMSARSPSAIETTATTTTGMSTDADLGMNQPMCRQTISTAMNRLGSALFITHMITRRASTPGVTVRPR